MEAHYSTFLIDVTSGRSNSTRHLPKERVVRFREGRPKSHNGCVVCKIRRVKCDETKPSCRKCTSTGRKCEGFAAKPPKRTPRSAQRYPEKRAGQLKPLAIYNPSLDIEGSVEERRSFHYFRSRHVSEMPGNFEGYFWDHTVLQFCQKYPVVKQCLVTLGAIYEERERSSGSLGMASVVQPLGVHALQQYNKAIRHLVNHLSSAQIDTRAALVSCLLFVWIEVLQEKLPSAFRHLNSGLKILKDIGPDELIERPTDSEGIYASLDRSFTRLRVQSVISGTYKADFIPTRASTRFPTIPDVFSSMYEARNCLDREMTYLFEYVRNQPDITIADAMEAGAFDETLLTVDELRNHVDRFKQWKIALDLMIANQSTNIKDSQSPDILYLQLYQTVVPVVIKTLFPSSEMFFDDMNKQFERIVSLSESLIITSKSTSPKLLSFDEGVIPPLMIIAQKCPDIQLRRKAIALLKQAPEQEGMWRRDNVIKFCEWKLMELENDLAALPDYGHSQTGVQDSQLLPKVWKSSRIQSPQI